MAFAIQKRVLTRLFILLAVLVAVQGMTAAQDTGSLQFVTWTESNNQFAFDIPYGWNVEAYVVNVLGQGVPYVYVFEPQERAVVIAGAPSSVAYLDLDPSLGYAEGDQVPLEGFTFTIGAYQTPAQFLENYLRTDVLADACDTLFIVEIGEAPAIDPDSVAADVSLECHSEEGMSNGYFYLQTMAAPIEGAGQMWMPTDFYGYLAEPEMEAQAEQAFIQMANSFTISEILAQPNTTVVNNTADTPVNQTTTDSGYDPDAYLQAQQELYQQQQTTAMISNMLQMQHETSMAIINNIGSSSYDYEYEWVWTP